MNFQARSNQNAGLSDATPATLAIAALFLAFVIYFILEHYFMAEEYYAKKAPYHIILLISGAGLTIAFTLLKKLEPETPNRMTFSLLFGFGIGLATYSFISRLNILTDTDGLRDYSYTLTTDYVWKPHDTSLPDLHLYLKGSDWWQQYKPGDSYTFQLRKGGLAIWQVNMANIYEEQKRYYDCGGAFDCMTK